MEFKELPRSRKDRCVGLEFELAGVRLEECLELITDLYGGQVESKHSLESEVVDTRLGTFKVELDAGLFKRMAERLETYKGTGATEDDIIDLKELKLQLSHLMGSAASQIVPLEIVAPPIPATQLDEITPMMRELHSRQAEGTRSAITNAFGMHINMEVMSEEVEYLCDMMRAFLILYPWIRRIMGVDLTRRALVYIDPFPEDYVRLILQDDYHPDLDTFIRDYITHNPTRNRALDMLPLFKHLKPDAMKGVKESEQPLINARPTFHYRLPNCEIDNPNWRVARDWNYWLEVEALALDKAKLKRMSSSYLRFLDQPLHLLSDEWIEEVSDNHGYKQAV